MNTVSYNLFRQIIGSNFRRHIHRTKIVSGTKTYEGDGKTTLKILNSEADIGLMIDGYSQVGFRLNNDITVLGPMAIFPRSVLSWNIEDLDDIKEESLSLFTIIEPKIDILVLGIGDKTTNFNFFHKFVPFSKKHKIAFEVMPTEQAVSTFNFLNSEGRNVAGAMIPPKQIETTDDDELQSKLRYASLYEVEH